MEKLTEAQQLFGQREFTKAISAAEKAAKIFRGQKNTPHLLDALRCIGDSHLNLGELDKARKEFAELIPMAQAAGDALQEGLAHWGLGNVLFKRGDLAGAQSEFLKGEQNGKQISHSWLLGWINMSLAQVLKRQQNLGQAVARYTEARKFFEAANFPSGVSIVDNELVPLKGSVPQFKDGDLLAKFRQIIEMSSRVKMAQVAKSLQLAPDDLFEKLLHWVKVIPFKIEEEVIVVDDVGAFTKALDAQFKEWTDVTSRKDGKI